MFKKLTEVMTVAIAAILLMSGSVAAVEQEKGNQCRGPADYILVYNGHVVTFICSGNIDSPPPLVIVVNKP